MNMRWIDRILRLALVGAMIVITMGPTPADAADPFNLVFERTIGESGHAGLYGWGAATMRDGSVLIGDYWNKRVLRYNTDGSLVDPVPFIQNNSWPDPTSHQSPYGLGVDPDTGDVYLADTDRRQIDRYDEAGTYIGSYGQDGVSSDAPGHFRYPSRVAVHGGFFYVSDTWANRLVVYATNRDPVDAVETWSFGTTGGLPGQFKQPRGLSFDADGRLYVADHGNKRIQVFDTDPETGELTYVDEFGQAYDPDDPTPPPDAVIRGDMRGLAVDQANNWVYLVDGEGNRVHKFTTDGVWIRTWGSNGFGDGQFNDGGREVTVDGDGHVWVGDMPNFRAQVFTSDGVFLMAVPNPPEPPPDGGFNGPRGVAVDDVGNIFVTDTYNWRIVKFDANGDFVTDWGRRGRGEYEFNYARLIAVDPSDPPGAQGVVVADTDNNRIEKYTNDGIFVWSFGEPGNGPGQFHNPHGVDVGPDGRVYVADTNQRDEFGGAGGRVQVLGPDDAGGMKFLYEFNTVGGGSAMKRPLDVAIDTTDCTDLVAGDCTLWVTDSTADAVYKFDNAGNYLDTFGGKAPDVSALEGPFGIETDAENVYVADTPTNQIKVWSKADGTFLGAWAPVDPGGRQDGKLLTPQGLDMTPGGNLYITEREGERISHWRVSNAPPPEPPVNETLPSVSGDALVDGTLTADVGTWTGEPTDFAYQWQRCDGICSDITGATSSSYVVTSGDVGSSLLVEVTAWNGVWSDPALSAETDVVPEAAVAPSNVSPPTVTGVAEVGHTLSATEGVWSGTEPIDFTYQWQRCDGACSDISGATGSSHVVSSGDIGSSLAIVVTAMNDEGLASVSSVETAVVPEPPAEPGSVSPPTVTGVAEVGESLSASAGSWTGDKPMSFGFQWQRCDGACSDISGATGETYAVTTGDVGFSLRVVETATNAAGSSSVSSTKTGVVPESSAAPSVLVLPAVSGVAEVGGTLAAAAGVWVGTAPISFGYQWQRCDG
ncbi:MAG: hypothetical protein DRJ50_07890, partial [Actinobacteria bacterium]